MDFPGQLWTDERDRQAVRDVVELFVAEPIILTDHLTNSVYFSAPAEALFGDRAEAIVNRTAASLLGFGRTGPVPPALTAALLGEALPWKALVRLDGGQDVACEASALHRDQHLVCGLLRFFRPQSREQAR